MKIQDLLNSPDKWLRHGTYEAVDKSGKGTFSLSHQAVKWTLAGAIVKCAGNVIAERELLGKIGRWISEEELNNCRSIRDVFAFIDYWNDKDTTTFEELQRMLIELNV